MNNGKRIYIIAFSLIVVISGILFGYLFNAYNRTEAKVNDYQAKVEEYQENFSDLRTDIATIKADLVWVKMTLTTLQQKVK